ncbi:MarR family winged helix-turn-helix transcriptional regulator [Nonomuraea ferruginea]
MQDRTLAETLSRSPGRLLRRVYARFTAEALSDDPRSRDFVVLDTLADQDADSQLELAERLGINRTIMVRLVDRLQQAGYVTRTRNPANRRSYVLSITEEGRKARDAMREAVAERDARVTASLTPRRTRAAQRAAQPAAARARAAPDHRLPGGAGALPAAPHGRRAPGLAPACAPATSAAWPPWRP